MIVTRREDVRDWVVENITVKELDSMTCSHCGATLGASVAIDLITEAIINHTDRPGWHADWGAFLTGLVAVDDLLDLIQE